MTPAPIPTSIIIVSRHRPEALQRAVRAVRQLDHPLFELIVVADPAAAAATDLPGAKIVSYDDDNISAARNAGLALAAGDVVAFLDDDAVPEPDWLCHLTRPFADDRVVAATGFVRGRNGFSFQWRAAEVDLHGRDHPLEVPPGPSLHPARPGRAVKTQGTNCAFRRMALLQIGGFDPAFRFYLDEADVNLRLAAQGLTAVVPDAVVHHGYAASVRRRADRAPLTLRDIGASTVVFLRRHLPRADRAGPLAALRDSQRRRLLRMMVEGRIEPSAVAALLTTLEAGIADGESRPLPLPAPITGGHPVFSPLPGQRPLPRRVLTGRNWQARRLSAEAGRLASGGALVTLFLLSPTALRHRHVFHRDGYWLQKGGLFGAADRSDPVFRPWRFGARILRETRRWPARSGADAAAASRLLSGGPD